MHMKYLRISIPTKVRSANHSVFFCPQAYISCALGIHSVGYVMICFGVVNAICSLLFGTLMKYIGRSPLMGLGFAIHACLIWVLIIWRPHPSSPHIFFTISGLWGVGDAVWQTQVNGKWPLEISLSRHLPRLAELSPRRKSYGHDCKLWLHSIRKKSHGAGVVEPALLSFFRSDINSRWMVGTLRIILKRH